MKQYVGSAKLISRFGDGGNASSRSMKTQESITKPGETRLKNHKALVPVGRTDSNATLSLGAYSATE